MTYKLYRAIKGKGARLSDFWSAFALGEEPFLNQLTEPLEWSGVSTFMDVVQAKKMAILWRQGQYLAVLEIPDNTTKAIVRKTEDRIPATTVSWLLRAPCSLS